ncbi:MAG: phosphatidate cytidylyltransferase [Sulfurimicrobium sp.]|nr:phosphatidate cytidylyltransferase [Sulfurimicrobium sp.]MDO9189514.1 phosphatidate cytidylyltransferase [Sulfurimicrobium sp.]MDP2199560.1 phosphatidate cytidylyltransferase [Sulfurimicrobium sp.]MDP3686269.1 phosphatidate cytidylyltransferase [Sulfurimicrobium sp.]
MLKTRVITAIALLFGVLFGLFFLPSLYWGWLTLGVIAIGAWEWGAMAAYPKAGRWAYLLLTIVLGLSFFALNARVEEAYLLAVAFWLLLVFPWLLLGWKVRHPALLAATGWMVLFPTWFALMDFHAMRPALLFGLLAVVAVADIGAYFSGRAFGKHKLAPSISPGKTWEGVVGGLLGVALYGALWVWMESILGVPFPGFILVLAMASLSVVGDLFESWLKRQAGIKDSGHILPGHGGVLDRLDGMTAALPLAAAVYFASGSF